MQSWLVFLIFLRWQASSQDCRQTAVLTITRNGRSQQEIHVQRGYPVGLVVQLLQQAGLTPLGTHDFQTLGRPQRSSPRVVYVARKRSA